MISLISVELSANTDKFESAMQRTVDVADASFSAAAANADQFQSAFDRASSAASSSSQKMAADFEAANERIAGAAGQSSEAIDSINGAADNVDISSWTEKVSSAIGAGFATGLVVAQTWMDKVEEFLKMKVIIIGAALAIGVSVAVASAIYVATKVASTAADFIVGLFTGDAYKSENIDAVIALNKELGPLQEGLLLSAAHASALNAALKSSGVDAAVYVSTINGAEKAARTNAQALQELGIETHDYFGEVRSSEDILRSAKRELDAYADGYDRNAAAAAMGLGTYKQISDALSITSEKVEIAGQRLADYNLIIGAGTQEAVGAYERAVADFERESELMSQSFKKAISDQIMPILTDLAVFFKEGFPFVVNVFRYSMATLVSIFYGLKEVAYVVAESVIQSFKAVGDVVSRVVGAIAKAATGNIEGAWSDLKAVPDDLSKRWTAFGDNVVAQSVRNSKAMALAWGADNFSANSIPDPAKTGKKWHPATPEDKSDDPRSASGGAAKQASAYQTFLEQIDQMNARMESNQYVMLKVKAAQLAWNESISATSALQKIEALQLAESEKAVKDYGSRLQEENRRILGARGSIGLYGIELDTYVMREQRRADVMARINQLEAAGKPLTDAARDSMLAQADAAANAADAIMRQNDALSRTYEVGAKRAFDAYMDNATNAAKTAEEQFTNAYRGIQGAMADFLFNPFDKGVKGMLSSFGTMLQRMIADAAAADLSKRLFGAVGTPGIGGLLSSLMSAVGVGGKIGAQGYGLPDTGIGAPIYGGDLPSFAVGTDFVPRDMVAQLHQGEKVVPAAQNNGSGLGSLVVNQHFHGQTSVGDVRRAGGDLARNLLGIVGAAGRFQ